MTGGHTLVPNFDARLRSAVQPSLPMGSPLNIVRSGEPDPSADAWRGMARWSQRADSQRGFVTSAQWDEYGVDYLGVHGLGNMA